MSDETMEALVRARKWCITPAGMQQVLGMASAVEPLALQAYDAEDMHDDSHCADRRGDVCVLKVRGPLLRHADFLLHLVGGTSYGWLRKDLQAALDDPSIQAILVDVDSPGGETNGIAELAAAFYAARGRKPMACYVSGDATAAAYWLAAAVGEIYCSPTSMLGGIGIRATLIDDTGAQKLEGRRRVEIVSEQSPGKASDPADASYRRRVQAVVDKFTDVMVADIAKYRGVRERTVLEKYGAGDVLIGSDAVTAGLADGLSSTEAMIARLTGAKPRASASTAGYGSARRSSTTSTAASRVTAAESGRTETDMDKQHGIDREARQTAKERQKTLARAEFKGLLERAVASGGYTVEQLAANAHRFVGDKKAPQLGIGPAANVLERAVALAGRKAPKRLAKFLNRDQISTAEGTVDASSLGARMTGMTRERLKKYGHVTRIDQLNLDAGKK